MPLIPKRNSSPEKYEYKKKAEKKSKIDKIQKDNSNIVAKNLIKVI